MYTKESIKKVEIAKQTMGTVRKRRPIITEDLAWMKAENAVTFAELCVGLQEDGFPIAKRSISNAIDQATIALQKLKD